MGMEKGWEEGMEKGKGDGKNHGAGWRAYGKDHEIYAVDARKSGRFVGRPSVTIQDLLPSGRLGPVDI